MTSIADLPPIKLIREDYNRLLELAAAGNSPVAETLLHEVERARIDDGHADAAVVRMGSVVEFRDDESGRVRTIQLVYPKTADAAQDKFSVLTPVGAALIGLSEGQSIDWRTPEGDRKQLTVLKVQQEDQTHSARAT